MNFEEVVLMVVLIIILIVPFLLKQSRNGTWVNQKDFENWKIKISKHCDEEAMVHYMKFLDEYGGGYIKRSNGQIIYQEYLGKEKGALKGIFFNVVVKNRKLSIKTKEDFRKYLIKIGVDGLYNKPIYEQRDGKLRNDGKDEKDREIKYVGNKGEHLVRAELDKLDKTKFIVISGVVLKNNENVREFDHIVIGNDVVYILETKAFGISGDNRSAKSNLYIDKDYCWRLKKNGKTRELESPAEQVIKQKNFIDEILNNSFLTLVPIVVLPNPELTLKQNVELDFKVLLLKDVLAYINEINNPVSLEEPRDILKELDNKRIN